MNTLLFKYLHTEKRNVFRNSHIRDAVSLGLLSTMITRKDTHQERTLSEKQYKFNLSYSRATLTFTKDLKLCDLREKAQGIIYSRIEEVGDGKR
jgi:hypothetical protein